MRRWGRRRCDCTRSVGTRRIDGCSAVVRALLPYVLLLQLLLVEAAVVLRQWVLQLLHRLRRLRVEHR